MAPNIMASHLPIIDHCFRNYTPLGASSQEPADRPYQSPLCPALVIPEFRTVVAYNVAALNSATRDIAAEHVRLLVCWGAGERPHNHDVPLRCIGGTLVIRS